VELVETTFLSLTRKIPEVVATAAALVHKVVAVEQPIYVEASQ
jgi:hypothetical protein